MEHNFVLNPALPPVKKFADMELSDDIIAEVITSLQATATPVQQYLVPALIRGGDVLACVPEDAGSTASYLIAAMHVLTTKGVFSGGHGQAATPTAVILLPTRSLVEVCSEVARSFIPFFGKDVGQFKCVELFGGTPVYTQLAELQNGCDLLIATPGRLIDLVQLDVLNFSSTKMLVFDAIDRMMDMGFEPQLRSILDRPELPGSDSRQTLLISATVDGQVQNLADDILDSSNKYDLQVAAEGDNNATPQLPHVVKFVDNDVKVDELIKIVGEHPGQFVLVYVATKNNAEHVHKHLKAADDDGSITSDCIHGDKMQGQREETLEKAACGQINVLIVTDVASRGISLPTVDVLVQYDLPPHAHFDERLTHAARLAQQGSEDIQIVSFFNSNNNDVVEDLIEIMEHQTDSTEAAESLARLTDVRNSL